MAWVLLFIAGLFEIIWATGLKYTEGWTRFFPSLLTITAMFVSFYFLSLAIRTLPLGTAYAVWTGIGTVGAMIVGLIFFDESHDISKYLCILLIVIGVAGLKLTSAH